MSAVRFMFIACSSLFVATAVSYDVCPGNTDHFGPSAYEGAQTRSINKFLKRLRDGTANSTLTLANNTTIVGNITTHVINSRGNLTLQLENIAMTGFSGLRATDVDVNSDDNSSNMKFSVHVKVDGLSGTGVYYINGTWNEESYSGNDPIGFYYDYVTAIIRVSTTLDKGRKHWKIKTLEINERDIEDEEDHLYVGFSTLSKLNDGFRNNLVPPEAEILKNEIKAQLEMVMLKHFEVKVREFLDVLFENVRWYAIIFGRFETDDYRLYHQKTII